MAIIDVTWTNLVNTAVDFYGDLEKISGTNDCGTNATAAGDAGAKARSWPVAGATTSVRAGSCHSASTSSRADSGLA